MNTQYERPKEVELALSLIGASIERNEYPYLDYVWIVQRYVRELEAQIALNREQEAARLRETK